MIWHMADRDPQTFAEKFEEALEADPALSLRGLARKLAKGDQAEAESIRRRLNKYRPKTDGGAAEVKPTAPTRWEIEDAMGLERDALAPDEGAHPQRKVEGMVSVLLDEAILKRLLAQVVEEMAA